MFIQALFEGLVNGTILALVAMGIALVRGVMNLISFTQGEFLMLGMYVTLYLKMWFNLDPILTMPFSILGLFLVGVIIYKILLSRVLRGPSHSQRLLTFALSMVLMNMALVAFGGIYQSITDLWFEGNINLGFLLISKQKLIPLVTSLLVTYFLFTFINKTKTGKAIIATAQDKQAAALVGINTDRSFMYAFGLAAAIAGAAGTALTYYYLISPSVGSSFQLLSFIAVTLGGFGNIYGAFLGGLLIGVIDIIAGVYINTALKYFFICVVFLLSISFKPQGLFGGKKA